MAHRARVRAPTRLEDSRSTRRGDHRRRPVAGDDCPHGQTPSGGSHRMCRPLPRPRRRSTRTRGLLRRGHRPSIAPGTYVRSCKSPHLIAGSRHEPRRNSAPSTGSHAGCTGLRGVARLRPTPCAGSGGEFTVKPYTSFERSRILCEANQVAAGCKQGAGWWRLCRPFCWPRAALTIAATADPQRPRPRLVMWC